MAVRPAKTQISLGIRPVWSESLLSAWRKLGSLATHWVRTLIFVDFVMSWLILRTSVPSYTKIHIFLPVIFSTALENKNLSWLFGVDRKIYPKGHCSSFPCENHGFPYLVCKKSPSFLWVQVAHRWQSVSVLVQYNIIVINKFTKCLL